MTRGHHGTDQDPPVNHPPMEAPGTGHGDEIRALATDLRLLPYTADAVGELLGPMAVAALDREQAEPARRRVDQVMEDDGAAASQRALAAVVSAWMLGDPVPVTLLETALPGLGAAGACRLNLGWTRRGWFHPVIDLSPYASDVLGDLWLASDQTSLQSRTTLPGWHVLGIGRASLTLAGTVARTAVDTALDLGCGCGIQTLHLLAHSRHITATDLSERALRFTAFNLALNTEALGLPAGEGVWAEGGRITLRHGDLLEPVAGQRFDLVVSNPPFVITPRGGDAPEAVDADALHTYRDGGRPGDTLLAGLVRALPEHLEPGGVAHLLGNWEIHHHDDGRPVGAVAGPDDPVGDSDGAVVGAVAGPDGPVGGWQARLRSWVPEGADAWFIQRDVQDAAGYAETWLQDSSDQLDPDRYAAGYRRYLEDFQARGVEAVGFGYGWLRRPVQPRPGRIRTEELTGELAPPLGPAWADTVVRWDLVTAPDGSADLESLRALHLRVPPEVTEERHQRFGAADPEVILARQGGGFRRTARLDTATAGFLAAADGEFTAGQLAGAVAGLLDLDAAGERALLGAVAALFRDGFVTFDPSLSEAGRA